MSLPDTEVSAQAAGHSKESLSNSTDRRDAARAFGQTIRAARLARGFSQEQLAEAGDFDRTYPSLLERGLRTPTFFVIVRLAEGLNTDPVALFREAVARLHRQVPP
jgi:ribosome-binding protein aMBF1 (putative translation factor)